MFTILLRKKKYHCSNTYFHDSDKVKYLSHFSCYKSQCRDFEMLGHYPAIEQIRVRIRFPFLSKTASYFSRYDVLTSALAGFLG